MFLQSNLQKEAGMTRKRNDENKRTPLECSDLRLFGYGANEFVNGSGEGRNRHSEQKSSFADVAGQD